MKKKHSRRALISLAWFFLPFAWFLGCSPSGETSSENSSGGQAAPSLRNLPMSELGKLELELDGGEAAVYNGTDWVLTSADIQVSAQVTNGLQEVSRRFRLYPQDRDSNGEKMIKPYTTSPIEWLDLARWMTGKKFTAVVFVEAEGYRE